MLPRRSAASSEQHRDGHGPGALPLLHHRERCLHLPAPGDSGYRGEIIIIAKNLTEEFFNITKGQKIAQIIIQEIGTMPLVESKILDGTDRENNGFGSSGKF